MQQSPVSKACQPVSKASSFLSLQVAAAMVLTPEGKANPNIEADIKAHAAHRLAAFKVSVDAAIGFRGWSECAVASPSKKDNSPLFSFFPFSLFVLKFLFTSK